MCHEFKLVKMIYKCFPQKLLLSNSVATNRAIVAHFSSAQLDISPKNCNKFADPNSAIDEITWENAQPYESIPRPSTMRFIASFLPGGKNYKKNIVEVVNNLRKEYGDIMVMPGTFGKKDIVITFNPVDFQKVFRTEGQWPERRGMDAISHYRTVLRKSFYKKFSGLAVSQGEEWGEIRTAVNPILMQPKNVKPYIPTVDDVAKDFVKRVQTIRDNDTLEVPNTFDDEVQRWAFESIGLVALDKRLGLIAHSTDDVAAKQLMKSLKEFFQLASEVEIKPSLWKIYPTQNYKKLVKSMDTMIDISSKYIDEALERMKTQNARANYEKSVLEKLLQIDRDLAIIMAMDLLIAGIDTTSSAFFSCLQQLAKNPDKQDILLKELIKIFPNKTTSLTVENMQNLPYLRACIKESFRLTPVTIGNFRTTGQDVVLSGYRVPKGTNVSMMSATLQKDEANYPDALKYIPERWLRDRSEVAECPSARNANPFIYLPFGFGPRMCVGKRFVDLELEVGLSRIVRNFKVEHHHPELIFQTNIINYPTGDFRFKFIDID